MAAAVPTLALSPSGDRLASKLSGRKSATPRADETSWCAASRSSADGWRIISRFVAGNPRTVSDEDRRVSIGSVCTSQSGIFLKEILLREKTPPKSATKPRVKRRENPLGKKTRLFVCDREVLWGRLTRTFATGEDASSDKQRERERKFYTLDI